MSNEKHRGTFRLEKSRMTGSTFSGVQVGPRLWVDPGEVRAVERIADLPGHWITLIFIRGQTTPMRSVWTVDRVIKALNREDDSTEGQS